MLDIFLKKKKVEQIESVIEPFLPELIYDNGSWLYEDLAFWTVDIPVWEFKVRNDELKSLMNSPEELFEMLKEDSRFIRDDATLLLKIELLYYNTTTVKFFITSRFNSKTEKVKKTDAEQKREALALISEIARNSFLKA